MDARSITDNALRGTAISAILRVATGRPIFVQGTLMDGVKFAGASIAYDIVKPVVNPVLPAGLKLPNGGN